MSKKTKIIIIAVVAVVAVGGIYYSYNNYRKQQLVRAYLTQLGIPPAAMGEAMKQLSSQDMAALTGALSGGGALGGLAGALTGGAGTDGGGVAGGLAGLFGGGAGDMPVDNGDVEEEEKPQSPEEIYDEAAEMQVFDDNSKFVVAETKPIIEQVFSKTKMTAMSGNFGAENTKAGMVSYQIARKIISNDMTLLNKALTDKGYVIMMSGLSEGQGSISANKGDSEQLTVSFKVGEQVIEMYYYKAE